MSGLRLAVKPVIDHGQYDHSMNPKDRIIENLRAELRIRDRKIEDQSSQIIRLKSARKSKLLSELDRLDEQSVSELELIMTKYEERA